MTAREEWRDVKKVNSEYVTLDWDWVASSTSEETEEIAKRSVEKTDDGTDEACGGTDTIDEETMLHRAVIGHHRGVCLNEVNLALSQYKQVGTYPCCPRLSSLTHTASRSRLGAIEQALNLS